MDKFGLQLMILQFIFLDFKEINLLLVAHLLYHDVLFNSGTCKLRGALPRCKSNWNVQGLVHLIVICRWNSCLRCPIPNWTNWLSVIGIIPICSLTYYCVLKRWKVDVVQYIPIFFIFLFLSHLSVNGKYSVAESVFKTVLICIWYFVRATDRSYPSSVYWSLYSLCSAMAALFWRDSV